jgi:hypothetical protein
MPVVMVIRISGKPHQHKQQQVVAVIMITMADVPVAADR